AVPVPAARPRSGRDAAAPRRARGDRRGGELRVSLAAALRRRAPGRAGAGALARADVIAPAPWAATAAAAFSVAYVAAENRLSRSVKLRVATAALFGLVHGMALAPR